MVDVAGLNIDGLLAAVFDGFQRLANLPQLLALLLLENIFPQNLEAFADCLRSCVGFHLGILCNLNKFIRQPWCS